MRKGLRNFQIRGVGRISKWFRCFGLDVKWRGRRGRGTGERDGYLSVSLVYTDNHSVVSLIRFEGKLF